MKRIFSVLLSLATILVAAPAASAADPVVRVAGNDRVATSVALSQQAFSSADTVLLATSLNFPDALAGAPLAKALNAPILLTPPDSLDSQVVNELSRLGATNVMLLGGTAALSDTIRTDLENRGYAVDRAAGMDRFDTAGKLAQRLATASGTPSGAYIVNANGFPDAVSVSAVAARAGWPILGVTSGDVPAPTLAAIDNLGIGEAVVIGGTAVVTPQVETQLNNHGVSTSRLFGADRYATSGAVAQHALAKFGPANLWLATGANFPDALAAGPAVAASNSMLMLNPPDALVNGDAYDATDYLRAYGPCGVSTVTTTFLVGGSAALSGQVEADVQALMQGQNCTDPVEPGHIEIIDVLADAPGYDDAFDGGEYLDVRNVGNQAVTMTGWYVLDAANNRLPWCDITINPGATARLYSADGNNGPDHCHAKTGTVLNNDGDTLRLYRPDDTLSDTYSY